MTIAAPEHDLTIHGEAEAMGQAGDLPELVQALDRLSGRGRFLPRDWDGFLYVVRVDRIFLSS